MEIEPPIKTKHTRTTGHHALFHCSIATKPQIIARLPVVIHSAVASGIVSWCVEFRRVTILQLGCSSTKGLWVDRNGSFGRPNDRNLTSSRTISKSHANFMQSPYVIRKYRIDYISKNGHVGLWFRQSSWNTNSFTIFTYSIASRKLHPAGRPWSLQRRPPIQRHRPIYTMHLCTCEGLNYMALHEYLLHLTETSHIFPHRLTAPPKFAFIHKKWVNKLGNHFELVKCSQFLSTVHMAHISLNQPLHPKNPRLFT